MCAELKKNITNQAGLPAVRPAALSVAGFDPSAGAGVLSDIKTFEALGVYGFAACSALTVQNERRFKSVSWLKPREIISQIEGLLECHTFSAAKVGIVENLESLALILNFIKGALPSCKVVWDPILQTSSGFSLHTALDRKQFEELCKNIFVLTPNYLELKALYPQLAQEQAARALSQHCAVLLKGGHAEGDEVLDQLYWREECYEYCTARKAGVAKHGSGCVHSAALSAYLAKGISLEEAAPAARDYCLKFLESGSGLLGYHQIGND